METRRFGRTGHMSTVAIFGGAAFWEISQADADKVMEQIIEAGVNHLDIAPSYGQAEERVGPWMPRERLDRDVLWNLESIQQIRRRRMKQLLPVSL